MRGRMQMLLMHAGQAGHRGLPGEQGRQLHINQACLHLRWGLHKLLTSVCVWSHCHVQDHQRLCVSAGPLNYNPVEEWFFHRIKEGRPIPVPGSGQQVCFADHMTQVTA